MRKFIQHCIIILSFVLLGCSQIEKAPSDQEVQQVVEHQTRLNIGRRMNNIKFTAIQREPSKEAVLKSTGSKVMVYPINLGTEITDSDGASLQKLDDLHVHYFFRLNGTWNYTMHPDADLQW